MMPLHVMMTLRSRRDNRSSPDQNRGRRWRVAGPAHKRRSRGCWRGPRIRRLPWIPATSDAWPERHGEGFDEADRRGRDAPDQAHGDLRGLQAGVRPRRALAWRPRGRARGLPHRRRQPRRHRLLETDPGKPDPYPDGDGLDHFGFELDHLDAAEARARAAEGDRSAAAPRSTWPRWPGESSSSGRFSSPVSRSTARTRAGGRPGPRRWRTG